jgi:molecular chaperone GrpE
MGVAAIPAKGEQFDPRFHEAIEMVETDAAPDHEVLEELQRGYRFRDRLLRPAMVKVASNPAR